MIEGRTHAVSGFLRLHGQALSVSPPLRAGETLLVRIVAQSGAGRWTVLVRGKTLVASSELSLAPGSVLAARVERQGSAILLKLDRSPADLARALAGARLPSDLQSQAAARALLSSGLGVSPERLERMRVAFRGPAEGLHRRLRCASELLKKLPDLGSEDLDTLLRLVQPGCGAEEGEEGERRERRRRDGSGGRKVSAGLVREALWGEGTAPGDDTRPIDLLRLANHSKPEDEVWVVLPCRVTDEDGQEVSGTLRVLYDTAGRAVRALTLGASVEGGGEWWFHLAPGPGGPLCRVFRDPESGRPVAEELEALRRQLGNLGVRLADTVGDGASFDGFGLVEPGEPRPVDLVG